MGFRVVLTVHDLIPVVAPQFTTQEMSERFESGYLPLVLRTADLVLTNSASTTSDLLAWAEQNQLEAPLVRQIPLCSQLSSLQPVAPTLRSPDRQPVERFVLCVGTIESRKNHLLLVDVWETLVRDLEPAMVPTLVLAGRNGWLNMETTARLQRTPCLRDAIVIAEGLSDQELAWL